MLSRVSAPSAASSHQAWWRLHCFAAMCMHPDAKPSVTALQSDHICTSASECRKTNKTAYSSASITAWPGAQVCGSNPLALRTLLPSSSTSTADQVASLRLVQLASHAEPSVNT
eukprot:127075-Amphidinium_carterae.1